MFVSDFCFSFLFCPIDDCCNTGEFYIEVASPSWAASGVRAVPEFDVDEFLSVVSDPGGVGLYWRNGGARSYHIDFLLRQDATSGLVSVPASEFIAEFSRVGTARCAWEAVSYQVLQVDRLEMNGV